MSLTAAVSPLLAPLRGTSWSGSVLATGRFGAYLSVPGAAVDVVPLLGVDAIALPTAVRLGVPFPHEALPLAVGDPVRLDDDGVTVAGLRVPLVRAWTPARGSAPVPTHDGGDVRDDRRRGIPVRGSTQQGRRERGRPVGVGQDRGGQRLVPTEGARDEERTSEGVVPGRCQTVPPADQGGNSGPGLRRCGGHQVGAALGHRGERPQTVHGSHPRRRPRVEAIGHGSGRDLIAGMAGLLSTIESQPALGRVS